MNMKTAKKMKGFMCHSPSSTAVCRSQDYRSVIVPRRPDRTLVDQVRLLNSTKYIRLGEQRAIPAASIRGSFPVSSLKNDQEKVPQEAATTTTSTTSLAISDNLFQVVHLVLC